MAVWPCSKQRSQPVGKCSIHPSYFDFALKFKAKKLEIGYWIIPVPPSSNKTTQAENGNYVAMLLAIAMKISTGNTPRYQIYLQESLY